MGLWDVWENLACTNWTTNRGSRRKNSGCRVEAVLAGAARGSAITEPQAAASAGEGFRKEIICWVHKIWCWIERTGTCPVPLSGKAIWVVLKQDCQLDWPWRGEWRFSVSCSITFTAAVRMVSTLLQLQASISSQAKDKLTVMCQWRQQSRGQVQAQCWRSFGRTTRFPRKNFKCTMLITNEQTWYE